MFEESLPLINAKWNNFNLQSPQDIDYAIKDLSESIFSAATKSCTLKHPFTTKTWWTSDLESLQRNLKLSRRRHSKYRTLDTKNDFLNARTAFTRAIRKAKLTFFKHKAESLNNPWKLYKYLGKKRNTGANITLSDENGNPIALDPNLNADTLLHRFFPDDNKSCENLYHYHTRTYVNDFLSTPPNKDDAPKISIQEVKNAFLDMSPFSSPGPDGIFAALVQWNIDILSLPLVSLFQSCLDISYFPKSWKEGTLLTIPKVDYPDKTSHKSQRPITLLSVLGKGLEKILLERFLFHEQSSSPWFHEAQQGFRKHSSTDKALLAQKIQLEKDRVVGEATALLKLDIQSAFDLAWHPAILRNLIEKGLPSIYVHLIASYLADRSIQISFGGGHAKKSLTLSTPQGAVLSPFLWNIFLDPILHKLQSSHPELRISAWADDVILAFNYRFTNPQIAKNKLHDIAKTLKLWADNNKASFAPNKSEVLTIRGLHNNTSLLTCNTAIGTIKGVSSLKILGVTFDETLTFIQHTSTLASTTKKLLFSLKSASKRYWKIPAKHFTQIFIGAILPKLFYAAPTWITLHKTALLKIKTILRLSATLLTHCVRDTPTNYLLAAANIPPPDLFLKQQAVLRLINMANHLSPKLSQHILNHTGPTTKVLKDACNSFGINWELLKLLSPKYKFGPHLLHPASRSPLNVSLHFDNFRKVTPSSLLICTDGSKEGEAVGSGLVIFQGSNLSSPIFTKSFGLPPYATVYNGESEVIPRALSLLSNLFNSKPFTSAHFYIDNQATLKNLIKPWKTKDTNIHRIYSAIQKLSFPVSFTYVPAHQGHLGNELADKAAKNALTQPISLYPKIPKHHFKHLINNSINSITAHRWNTDNHSHWIRMLFPTWKKLQSFLSLTEGLTQVRKLASGYYPLHNYLFQRSLVSSSNCPHCDNLQTESIYHRIFVCPAFQLQRLKLFLELDFLPRTTIEILTDCKTDNLKSLDTFLLACKHTNSPASRI